MDNNTKIESKDNKLSDEKIVKGLFGGCLGICLIAALPGLTLIYIAIHFLIKIW